MDAQTKGAVMSRVQAIASDIDALRRIVDAEPLSVSDRQYLSRCFELLQMELKALREYVGVLSST